MKSALIIIDVQQGLFTGEYRPFEADAVLTRINQLADRARAAGAPVIFVLHESPSGLLVHGSAAWQLADGLPALPTDHIVRKTTPDSFLRTHLQELLVSQGVAEVVICGVQSEFCVDTTTRRAAALGYPVTLAADAHSTTDKAHATAEQIRRHHNATLPDIRSFGPRIQAVPSADIGFGV